MSYPIELVQAHHRARQQQQDTRMNASPVPVTFVASPDPGALTRARNGMALAAADLLAAISPMLSPDQHAAIDEVLRHGGRLTCEQGSDIVGHMSTALCLVTASGARLELSAIVTPDRPSARPQ